MPKMVQEITNDMQLIQIPGTGNFQFSAVKPVNLGATEYTLATIVIDITGSVTGFADNLLTCLKTIVRSCQKNPRSENMMIRVIAFNTKIYEIHGFKMLNEINVNEYQAFEPTGMTALYDATYSGIAATLNYSKSLIDMDYDVNGAVYIITDGVNNDGTFLTPEAISNQLKEAQHDEVIESLITILVGLRDPKARWSDEIKKHLENFKKEANLTEFLDIGEATEEKLAKLAGWVSESISSQSSSLKSGAPSIPLQF